MKTKEMLKMEATIRATESLVEWIAQSDQLSDSEKQEAILKQMRQLNALIASAKNTNEDKSLTHTKKNHEKILIRSLRPVHFHLSNH